MAPRGSCGNCIRGGRAVALLIALLMAAGCGGSDPKDNSDKLAEQLLREQADAQKSRPVSAGGSSASADGGADLSNAKDAESVSGGAAAPAASSPARAGGIPKSLIGKTVWWNNFKVTVESVVGSKNALSRTVNVALSMENLGTEVASLGRANIVLTVGTQSYLSGMGDTRPVPPKAKGQAILDFLIDETFNVESAVLTFGNPDTNQAIVPFGSAPASTFEPRIIAAASELKTPAVTVSILGSSVDASYARGDKGKHVVRLPIKVRYTGGGVGGYFLSPAAFSLKSPAGNSEVATPIAQGDLVAEGVYTGKDLVGLSLAFKVDDIPAGMWTVTFTDVAGATASAAFAIA